jgi:hypothetical protein GHTCC_00640
MRELNNRELVKVVGAFAVPGAIAGGISGYAAYAGTVLGSGGKFNWRDATYATALGAAGGAIGGPVGITAAVDMIGVSAVGGLATGHLSKH